VIEGLFAVVGNHGLCCSCQVACAWYDVRTRIAQDIFVNVHAGFTDGCMYRRRFPLFALSLETGVQVRNVPFEVDNGR
jgi:hypothetical protein